MSQDPSVQSVARVYAVSLLNAAEAAQVVDPVLSDLQALDQEILVPYPQFEELLCGVGTSEEVRLSLIDRTLAPRLHPVVVNFLKVLARHHRLGLLPSVVAAVTQEHERRQGQVRVQVTTAVPLSGDSLEQLRQRLRETLSATPIVETTVDPQVVGGLLIRVGDTVYDGTVRNRLRQLRSRLRERYLNEVQRGRDRFSHSAGN